MITTRRILVAVAVAIALVAGVAAPADARTSAPARTVLGNAHLYAPYGEGWGTPHPREIFNGGDPSGHVVKLRWLNWGGANGRGFGYGSQFKPGGGYYSKPVRVQLVAKSVGKCRAKGPRAYTELWARFQNRPGGAMGPWFRWAGLKSICRYNG